MTNLCSEPEKLEIFTEEYLAAHPEVAAEFADSAVDNMVIFSADGKSFDIINGQVVSLVDVLVQIGAADSKTKARQLIKQKAVRISRTTCSKRDMESAGTDEFYFELGSEFFINVGKLFFKKVVIK